MDRTLLRHPITAALRRAAKMGAVPDEHELGDLNVDEPTRTRVRTAARQLADHGAQGGMRSKNRAAHEADRHAEHIIGMIPDEYADAVRPEPADADTRDAIELATAIRTRRRDGVTRTTSVDDGPLGR